MKLTSQHMKMARALSVALIATVNLIVVTMRKKVKQKV